jgi:hypothetical protein
MAWIDLLRAGIGTTLLFFASGGAPKPSGMNAVLLLIEGQVTITSPGEARVSSVRLAAQRQVLHEGDAIHLPAGAEVSLFCSTEKLVSLKGPRDWVLDQAACGPGAWAPEGSYRNLVAFAGRIIPSKDGFLILENETRHVRPGLGPFLLSPFDTVVMDSHPLLVWNQVPNAREYEIEIRGAAGMSIRLPVDDLHCGPGSGPWSDLDVCSWKPSGPWPALEPGKPLFLKLGSRQTATAPLQQAQEVYRISLLTGDEQRSVREDLHRIAELSVDKASRLLLSAGAYARRGLYTDAISNYDEALRAQEIPEARVTLGDLYLTAGLPLLADREYRQVLASGSPAAQAAAELGLGQVSYIRKRFDEARARFAHAGELYSALGLSAEAEEARAAAASLQAQNGAP